MNPTPQMMSFQQYKKSILFAILLTLGSCASKKEILYFQEDPAYALKQIKPTKNTFQPNDILKIDIVTLVPEAAIPYNKIADINVGNISDTFIKLNGYVVSADYHIDFPKLGPISVKNKTPKQMESLLKKRLVEEGHLSNPAVYVRLVNTKVTVLGEVNKPGTIGYVDPQLSILQVLGYAGGLTIQGKRKEVMLIREVDGVRKTVLLDLTSMELIDSPYYLVKPNDVIIVQPNYAKVKSAGFVGNPSTLVTIASLLLTTITLLTR